ncbi:hypothetical protein [Natrinema pallidum]|uniref:Uncharacterized protein n=2 Tax=Natrinema pallidum TaxID=69527 RepID=L9Z2J7_9EURY|nr:hypothetical protein [Natrinema pallidum]ELY80584.1 hypothetical protein C487_04483 [Natrinema pallidum DSM 3751]QCW02490.1 hypothetical protein FGF80_04255 [Natrinema pallidum]
MSNERTEADEDDETHETDKTEQLRSVFLSVTGGEADSVVEPQREGPRTRELRGEERTDEVVGPAEHHGLDDAIDDPEPG